MVIFTFNQHCLTLRNEVDEIFGLGFFGDISFMYCSTHDEVDLISMQEKRCMG